MSALEEPTIITSSESKYRSMFKSPKFIWKNNKTTPSESGDTKNSVTPIQQEKQVVRASSLMKLPTPSIPSFSKNYTHSKTTLKNEIYELSTINDAGIYLIPSTDSKHDHWLDVDDNNNEFCFFLLSHDCLTTVSGKPHCFYTPSSIMISA